MPEERYVSLRPSDAVHGGGMLPEGDYDIQAARFGMWDYAGTVPQAVPALAIDFVNADERVYTQWYSAGDSRNLAPSGDYKRLVAIGSSLGLNDGSNCFAFMASLVNAGFSEDKFSNDISVIVGTKVAVVHQATQERDIKGEKKRAGTIAVIGKIHSFPGEAAKKDTKKKSPSASKTAAGAAAAPASHANGDAIRPKAVEVLTTILKAAPDHQIAKKDLAREIFKVVPATDPDRTDVLQAAVQDAFLSSLVDNQLLYDVDGGKVIYVGD